MTEPLDQARIQSLLDELSVELGQRGARADIFLVGGGAMALATMPAERPATLMPFSRRRK